MYDIAGNICSASKCWVMSLGTCLSVFLVLSPLAEYIFLRSIYIYKFERRLSRDMVITVFIWKTYVWLSSFRRDQFRFTEIEKVNKYFYIPSRLNLIFYYFSVFYSPRLADMATIISNNRRRKETDCCVAFKVPLRVILRMYGSGWVFFLLCEVWRTDQWREINPFFTYPPFHFLAIS